MQKSWAKGITRDKEKGGEKRITKGINQISEGREEGGTGGEEGVSGQRISKGVAEKGRSS